MDIDRRKNQNCYNYREFGHLARNYRNRRTGNNRRLEYGGSELDNNLNGNRGLTGPN